MTSHMSRSCRKPQNPPRKKPTAGPDRETHGTQLWSDLHCDIFNLVLRRVLLTDRLRLAVVCSPWRRAIRSGSSPPPLPQLPWAIITHPSSKSLTVYSLSEGFRRYQIPLGMKPSRYGDIHGVPVSGASGWVLLSNSCCAPSPHLWNPASGKLVKLPQVISPAYTAAAVKGSAGDPNSIVVLRAANSVKALRLGEGQWIKARAEDHPRNRNDILVHCEGLFYSVSYRGDLHNYNTNEVLQMDISRLPMWRTRLDDYLLESLGEIWLVVVDFDDHNVDFWIKDGKYLSLIAKVFKADLQNRVWLEVGSLDDRDLFLSSSGSFALPKEETGSLGNSIHIAKEKKLKNGKCCWFHVEVEFKSCIVRSFQSRPQALWGDRSNTFWLQPSLH